MTAAATYAPRCDGPWMREAFEQWPDMSCFDLRMTERELEDYFRCADGIEQCRGCGTGVRYRAYQAARTVVMANAGLCTYCGAAPATDADHVIPLSRGGALDDPDNLTPACGRCNQRKGSLTPYEFMLWLEGDARVRRQRMRRGQLALPVDGGLDQGTLARIRELLRPTGTRAVTVPNGELTGGGRDARATA